MKRAAFAAIPVALALVALQTRPANAQQRPTTGRTTSGIVYGNDDRRDYYDVPDARWRARMARSVMLYVSPEQVDLSDPQHPRIDGPILRTSERVCSDDRFATQITAGECSATLIDDRLAITAGHCVADGEWEGKLLVFGFYYEREGTLHALGPDDVYRATRLVASEYSRSGDFGIIELDRPVVGHAPAPVRTTAPASDESVVVMGFPSTLPCKFDDGGTINLVQTAFFSADTDTFGGNSGSGVWDSNGRVIGMLSSGGQDYRLDRTRGCFTVNVAPPCTSPGCGESIARADVAILALCASGYASARLCGTASCGDMTCDPSERGSCELDCGDTPTTGSSEAGAGDGGVSSDGAVTMTPRPGCGCVVVGARGRGGFGFGSVAFGAGALALARGRRTRRRR